MLTAVGAVFIASLIGLASCEPAVHSHCGEMSDQTLPRFVHIGKTGGGTIQESLKKSGVSLCFYHQHPVKPPDLARIQKLFVTVRDPVQRVVSAYHWRLNHKKNATRDAYEIDMYRCFSTVDKLFDALLGKNNSTRCTKDIAERWVRGGVEHIGQGLEFYFKEVISEISSKDIFIIRQENMREDFKDMFLWLGISTQLLPELHVTHRSGGPHKHLNQSSISRLGQEAFLEEFKVLRILIDNSANLKGVKGKQYLQMLGQTF